MSNFLRTQSGVFVVTLLICTAFSEDAFAQVFEVAALDHSASNPSFPGPGLNTNITATERQLLVLSASKRDTWSIDSSSPIFSSSGNGITGDIPPLLTLGGFTFPHGALIGSLDEGKTFFAIGTQMEMTVLRPAAHYDYIVGILISLTTLVLLRVDVKVYPKPKSF